MLSSSSSRCKECKQTDWAASLLVMTFSRNDVERKGDWIAFKHFLPTISINRNNQVIISAIISFT